MKPRDFTIQAFAAIFWLALLAACTRAPTQNNPAPTFIDQAGETIAAKASATTPVENPPVADSTSTTAPATAESTAVVLPASGQNPAAGGKSSSTACPSTLDDRVAESATLRMGPSAGVPASTAKGEALIIIGTVYDANCKPLAGVLLNAWQTDPSGVYGPGHGSESLECCYFQGQVKTDENGLYKLITVVPGHYAGENPAPPAHIHLEVSHPQLEGLMAEIVFAGDPSLEGEFLGDRILVELEDTGDPDQGTVFKRGFADIILRGATGSAPAQPASLGGIRSFQIDPERSQAAYHIREKFIRLPIGIGAIGVSDEIEGNITVDLDDPQILRSMDVKVDLRALKSDKADRDEKLFDDWLETRSFPLATFLSTRVEGFQPDAAARAARGEPLKFTLWGDLTIRDVTREVPFEVTARISGDTLFGTASSRVKMTDFGIDPPNMLDFVTVEDEVELLINVVATEGKTDL